MLHELFRSAAVNRHSKTAVVDNTRRVTCGELQQAAQEFGQALRAAGAHSGDRVAVKLPNGIDAAVALWGTLEAGCVMVPVHAGLKGEALREVLEDADPHWLVDQPGTITQRTASTVEDSTGLAALIYTSGSTGEPKGVMLTHANMQAAIEMVNGYLQLGTADVIHSALPLSSSYGLYQLLLGLAVGATVVLDRGFSFPASSLALAARERATVLAAVPTMLGWMATTPLLEKQNLSTLRVITSAAAALSPAHSLKLLERLPQVRLYVMYGQTECKRISWLDPDDLPRHPDSVGRGLAGQQHRVITDAGTDAAADELGELIVRGPHVMQGYWRRPQETLLKLRPAADGGLPWMHTGDAFTADAEGFLRFAGRRDEMLMIGGHKVSPTEIEHVLCQIPGVLEAAVIGMPDEHWGQVVVAHVVAAAHSQLSEDEVKRYCSQRLRGFMVPRLVRFASELPKTASGKILKRALSS